MSSIKFIDELEAFFQRFIALINAHLHYYQIVAYERVMILVSKLIGRLILMITFLISSVFISIWAAVFIGRYFEDWSIGFLLVAVFYIIVGLIIYNFKNKLIVDPLIQDLSGMIEKKEEENEGLTPKS